MKKSGFYKLENGDYEYICGGKIVINSQTDLDKRISTLIISEANVIHKIGEVKEYKESYFAENTPRTNIVFDSVKSIQSFIDHLELLKKQLSFSQHL